VISTSDFGKKCLVLMGDFLNPGTSRQLQMIIKKKIKHIVIPNLHQNSTKNLPIPVLQGLIEIIKDEDLGSLFSDTCVFFIKWIKEVKKILVKLLKVFLDIERNSRRSLPDFPGPKCSY